MIASNPATVALQSVIDRLVDPQVGIISTLEEVRKEAGGPNFFHYRAKASNTAAFSREANFRDTGGAASRREVAVGKAVGEAVERYCASIFNFEELPLVSYDAASFACAAPDAFALYSAQQYSEPGFPWVPFTNETEIRWRHAVDALTGKTVYVPACRVYVPYSYYIGSGDAPIEQPISTGLACHFGYARAALSALCEAVERDSVMIAWQAMMSPPHIRAETLSDENYDLVQRLEYSGAKVAILDITSDHGIPAILSVLKGGTPSTPCLVFAGSASLSPEDAVRKSLEELAHTRRYSQYIQSYAPRLVPDPPAYLSIHDQTTHLNFYVDPANAFHADFLFASPVRKPFEELADLSQGAPERDLPMAVRRIADVAESVYLAEVTTPDIGELGLNVIRAVVPGFQPLHMGFRVRSLGGRRLHTVPQRLGYKGLAAGQPDNPAPHPYP